MFLGGDKYKITLHFSFDIIIWTSYSHESAVSDDPLTDTPRVPRRPSANSDMIISLRASTE